MVHVYTVQFGVCVVESAESNDRPARVAMDASCPMRSCLYDSQRGNISWWSSCLIPKVAHAAFTAIANKHTVALTLPPFLCRRLYIASTLWPAMLAARHRPSRLLCSAVGVCHGDVRAMPPSIGIPARFPLVGALAVFAVPAWTLVNPGLLLCGPVLVNPIVHHGSSPSPPTSVVRRHRPRAVDGESWLAKTRYRRRRLRVGSSIPSSAQKPRPRSKPSVVSAPSNSRTSPVSS